MRAIVTFLLVVAALQMAGCSTTGSAGSSSSACAVETSDACQVERYNHAP